MDTADLEKAVRLVLPALNLNPVGLELDRGFLARAQRTGQPRAIVLNRVTDQFVFVGFRAIADPDAVVEGIAAEALAFLKSYTHAICERLIVGWADSRGQFFAAAFIVSVKGGNDRLVGSSWAEPENWPEPMIDISKSDDDIIDDALSRLEYIVHNRTSYHSTDFDSALDRAVKLGDQALLHFGGEGRGTGEHPPVYATEESWTAWLYYFNQSVYDEWKRIGRSIRRVLPGPTAPSMGGPLKGLRVFLSYARPDATTLAWPIHEALSSLGAIVWFDQTQTLSEDQLAQGLAEVIGSNDVYVMCASNEFFERAGYATQEFAWAIQNHKSGGKLQHFLVVARPDTILPSSVTTWPMIELGDENREQLAHRLTSLLQQAVPGASTVPPLAPLATPFFVATLPSLPQHTDLPALWRRIQHVQLFDEIDMDTLTRLITGHRDDQSDSEARKRLLHLGEGLEWAGTLEDIDNWPDDPFIKAIRFRFACARLAADTYWPLNDDLHERPEVANEVEYLAMQRVPVLDWPAVPGWGDGERRLDLRNHAGLLRLLHVLLKRGLFGGLIHVPVSTIDVWQEALNTRRRECYDALLELRLNGRLSWQRDLPTWDALFRACQKLFKTRDTWQEKVPFVALQMLIGNASYIAAVASETGWYASRYGGFATQAFIPRGDVLRSIKVYAQYSGVVNSKATTGIENSLHIGHIVGVDISLSWQEA